MKLVALIRAVLREIFDEAAYERFCASEELRTGRESYAKFLDKAMQPAKQIVRCC